MKTNNYYFAIVVGNKVTKTFECRTENYLAVAEGMMIVELSYHKTAEMYIYKLNVESSEYILVKTMDARLTTIMPFSFDRGCKPFTLGSH